MEQAESQVSGAGHAAARPVGMLVAAAGVVYGDIGTSPLYTIKEVFSGQYGVQVNHDGMFGILALIFWRSEEHTSELQSLMRISYAVFCLKKKKYMYNLVTIVNLYCI